MIANDNARLYADAQRAVRLRDDVLAIDLRAQALAESEWERHEYRLSQR